MTKRMDARLKKMRSLSRSMERSLGRAFDRGVLIEEAASAIPMAQGSSLRDAYDKLSDALAYAGDAHRLAEQAVAAALEAIEEARNG